MTANHSIKKVISFIKSELMDFYPKNEINSFVDLIFEQLFNYSKTQLLISQDSEMQDVPYQNILAIIRDLKSFKPIQYILGKTVFYNLSFNLSPDVLIPRPETEELVDWILNEPRDTYKKIMDIGTGSGCIAISLAKNLPGSVVYACDISNDALIVTKKNCKLNNVNLQIMQLDILKADIHLDEKFDIIVSNPPYVLEKEKSIMHKNVLDYEPELALFVPNDDPLLFYRAIIDFGVNHLNKGGKIYFEVNACYGKEMALLLEERNFHCISLKKDINGKDRMLSGIL